MVRKSGRNHGEVFTKKTVVEYLLDEVGYTGTQDLRNTKILEPSAGHGAIAGEIVERLHQSSVLHGFSFEAALIENIRLVELNEGSFRKLVDAINAQLSSLGKIYKCEASSICIHNDFLRLQFDIKFDCIVGNPPYIRHELILESEKSYYKRLYRTFMHRADLYVPFFERGLSLLKENGRLSYICSNRWLTNQYGVGLRELIAKRYHLATLLNIEQTSPFDESVIAYPCIATIRNAQNQEGTQFCDIKSKELDFDSLTFLKVATPKNASWKNLFLQYDINHTALLGIVEQGFEIGIGVATGADQIFIGDQDKFHGIEKDRLLPLISTKDLKGNRLLWGGSLVLNPYENGTLCDLNRYPKLSAYLHLHKARLEQRHTAQKSPNNWYKTIDKIKPELQHKAKILLPDLSANNLLLIDEGQYYPHHNIYYIAGQTLGDLQLLAALLMSDFVRDQLSNVGVRMNGGFIRFQSQALRAIKIPVIAHFTDAEKAKLRQAFVASSLSAINAMVNRYCGKHGLQQLAHEPVLLTLNP